MAQIFSLLEGSSRSCLQLCVCNSQLLQILNLRLGVLLNPLSKIRLMGIEKPRFPIDNSIVDDVLFSICHLNSIYENSRSFFGLLRNFYSEQICLKPLPSFHQLKPHLGHGLLRALWSLDTSSCFFCLSVTGPCPRCSRGPAHLGHISEMIGPAGMIKLSLMTTRSWIYVLDAYGRNAPSQSSRIYSPPR